MSLDSDAWTRFVQSAATGDVVRVRVTRLLAYGAEVEVLAFPGVEGLIHISELSDRRIDDPREVVSELQRLDARIAKIDTSRRRLGLSLRAPR